MKNIVLTGFMASGKTEISKALSRIYNLKFIDTDELIVQKENRDINTIFATDGEEYFRDAETDAVREAAKADSTVIATGGGVVLRKENIDILRKSGVIYNLSPDFSIIAERVAEAAKTRPLMQNQNITEIKERFDNRLPFYANCDHKIIIKKEHTPDDIAKTIYNLHCGG